MDTHTENHGYQEIKMNPNLGDPKNIDELNKRRRQKAEGEDKPTLEELYHTRDEIQYQMERVPKMDRPVLEARLAQVELSIQELEALDNQLVA